MTPHEMVSELLGLLGDPAGRAVPPPLVLRYLNDANNEVADLLYPLMPSRFRAVSTKSGDGSTAYTLPTSCNILERLTVRATASSDEIDAFLLPVQQFNAVTYNSFFAASLAEGQVFYTHRGGGQVEVAPTITSQNVLTFYYRKKPISMKYDQGKGVYQVTPDYTLEDTSKNWADDEWEVDTSYVTFYNDLQGTETQVQSNTASKITFGGVITGLSPGVYDYEVYVKTDIPKQYHPLIVKKAQIIAERDPGVVQKLQSEFEKYLATLTAQGGVG